MNYGPHLTIDGSGCRSPFLGDVGRVYRFLDEMVGVIGMTKIAPPYVFEYREGPTEDWGVTGMVLIAESHVSVHTYPEKNFVFVDVFSCRKFDTDAAIDYAKDHFLIQQADCRVVERGLSFPRGDIK